MKNLWYTRDEPPYGRTNIWCGPKPVKRGRNWGALSPRTVCLANTSIMNPTPVSVQDLIGKSIAKSIPPGTIIQLKIGAKE